MNDKILKNALLTEKLYKYNKEEKHDIITELLKDNTTRGLAKELGIPHSTIHDWKSLRQNNTGKDIHISFNMFYKKLEGLNPKDIQDWGRLEMIKERIEGLIRNRD